jgi:hypothetical protein
MWTRIARSVKWIELDDQDLISSRNRMFLFIITLLGPLIFLSGIKWLELEADHSPLCSADENVWIYTATVFVHHSCFALDSNPN